ncbi:MAG TPA: DUF3306 domain-containing protein [Rubrivivax sp.]|nr:DUF3306 domain-containing protein [Rubrivivax sp.]
MNTDEPGQSFLSRWSRRKAQVRQGGEPTEVQPPPPVDPGPADDAPATALAAEPAPPAPEAPPAAPRPTLDDVQALTRESDFSRFVAPDVDPEVKNLAMKKLFADPHYNVMDGLDTYIDDYNTPDPVPAAMFKQLVQARMLGLLDDELEDQVATPSLGAESAAAAPAAGAEPAADPTLATDGAEPVALRDASGVPASPEDRLRPTAPVAVGGRAWESNPPGTA